MIRKLAVSLAIAMLMFVLAPLADANIVTFSEIILPSTTPLTNQYAAFDVTFSNTYYAIDSRFLQDGYGIAEAINPATIFFATPVSALSITWVTVNTDFVATAYDASNNVLSTFSAAACGADCEGVASLAGADISSVIWHDNAGLVGIDSLTFTEGSTATPEPSSLLLLGTGLTGLVGFFRRKISVM
jgi:hypothetical protein